MQNAMVKCGLTESNKGNYTDDSPIDAFVWYEQNWKHDDYNHVHARAQLSFVAEGYQYFHIDNRIYLVPQNHVIWIPSNLLHKTSTEAPVVDLMIILFKEVPTADFFEKVHIFAAPTVLKEMLWHASKWSQNTMENEEQSNFLRAILTSLPSFCSDNTSLQIPVPADERLLPLCAYINTNYKYTLDIEVMADKVNMSKRHLQRTFKQETGITLQKYIQLIRILKSMEFIGMGRYTLTEIAFMVGYNSLSAFTNSYKAIMKTKANVARRHILG